MLPTVDKLSKYVTDLMELSGKILNISIHIRIMGISDIALITLAVESFGIPVSYEFNSVPPIKNAALNTKITNAENKHLSSKQANNKHVISSMKLDLAFSVGNNFEIYFPVMAQTSFF